MSIHSEITLPETKPETEWVRGRPLQKVSPTYRHGRLQFMVSRALTDWAEGRGRVASEWRFRVDPPGEPIRPLVPDVAYLSYERLSLDNDAAAQIPLGTPNVAVEILSPDDRPADLEDRIATYLRAKCALVVVIDSESETVTAIDAAQRRRFGRGDTFQHSELDQFTVDVSRLFDEARR